MRQEIAYLLLALILIVPAALGFWWKRRRRRERSHSLRIDLRKSEPDEANAD